MRRSTGFLELRDGGSPWLVQKSPELTRYDPVELERELGPDRSFKAWAALVTPFPTGPTPDPPLFRKEVSIEFLAVSATPIITYRLIAAWPADYQIVSDGDGGRERLTLVYEGFVRCPASSLDGP